MSSTDLFNEVIAEFEAVRGEENQLQMNVEEVPVPEQVQQEDLPPFVLPTIDFNDGFCLRDMRMKAGSYQDDGTVLQDLGRIFRFIEGKNMTFMFKTWNSATNTFGIDLVPYGTIKQTLKTIHLDYHEKDVYSVADVLQSYLHYFSLDGICFSKNNNIAQFNLFRGWFFDAGQNAQVDMALVKPFLRFVHEVIGNGDLSTTNHILGWVASIMQNVGKKCGIALLLIGDEGAGKNFFTNILSNLFKGYALPNITDLSHVVGHFNEIIRGKVLIIVNEVENAQMNSKSLSEKLRSMITDDIVAVGQKYKATTLDINYANFILVSNNDVPVRMGMNDRHYLCSRVSSKKVGDHQFFTDLHTQTNTVEFYQALTQFFNTYDLTNYRPNEGLMNNTKRAILKESASDIDSFVIANYAKLCKGMSSDKIVPQISRFGFKTKDAFWKRLAVVCDKERVKNSGIYIYTLKDWAALKYMSIAGEVGE